MLVIGEILIIRLVTVMGDQSHHSKMPREKREDALDGFMKGRYTAVRNLTIEAAASMHGMHFHLNLRRAHAERTKWAKRNFPEIAADLDMVWSAYGDLGYNRLDGAGAREAVECMERIINGIEGRTGLRFA